MPLPIIAEVLSKGIDAVPLITYALRILPWVFVVWVLKFYFSGAQNVNERVMHSRVALVTGGTSGIGAAIVNDLASRGCQLVLLVQDPSDVFTIDYIEDLRTRHSNNLIYAEKCDLADLWSVRQFATKFIDNTPPRRVDMVICAAGLMAPPFLGRIETPDKVEQHLQINYLAHFHLLNILSPLLKVQPPDRDVRVLLATCGSYILGELELEDLEFKTRPFPSSKPWKVYGASKLALMIFGMEFQRRLTAYERPDKEEMNTRVFTIDPGFTRTPGSRRWLSMGSLWGLALYVLMWPIYWLVLKGPEEGAQTFLNAAMSPDYVIGPGGKYLRECKDTPYRKEGMDDPELGKQLWKATETLITAIEKRTAITRKLAEKADKSPEAMAKKAEAKKAKEEKELKLKLKAKEQEIRDKLLEKLIAEEEAKGIRELPPLVKKEVVEEEDLLDLPPASKEVPEPDTPARNTRSRSKTPKVELPPVEEAIDAPERAGTPSKATRRRTKKT